jgi:hypothetical protein
MVEFTVEGQRVGVEEAKDKSGRCQLVSVRNACLAEVMSSFLVTRRFLTVLIGYISVLFPTCPHE